MSHLEPPRSTNMLNAGPVRPRRPAQLRVARLAIGVVAILLTAGCAKDSGVTYSLGSFRNLLDRPTEAGFTAMIQANCAQLSVGNQTVGALLRTAGSFKELTLKLFRGEISNDEYINQVLLEYPAPDANVPATGCVVDQLQRCLSERCRVETAAEEQVDKTAAEAEVSDEAADITIDQTPVPEKDRGQVDEMIDQADADEPSPLP